MLKSIARKIPGISTLIAERNSLNTKVNQLSKELLTWKKRFVPPGHYYSPIPEISEIKAQRARIFGNPSKEIRGIDLNTKKQLNQLEIFAQYYAEMPFPEEQKSGCRYYLNNEFYAYSDGICLYSMMRQLAPKRFIEIGSGFSSTAALDTCDQFLGRDSEFAFIDPYPERLENLLTSNDRNKKRIQVIKTFVQNVPLEIFSALDSEDILFIDSSHVSHVGSDVNYLYFEVLPVLKPRVYIHIHDIFLPFEYPENWIYSGRSWNEIYLLRAFLQYNKDFEIVFFNSYSEQVYHDVFFEKMPLCLKKPERNLTIPGSLWLRKLR